MEKRLVTEYIAFDGTVFENEECCIQYEKKNSLISKFNTAMSILDDVCQYAQGCVSCPVNKICKKMDDITPWADYQIEEE